MATVVDFDPTASKVDKAKPSESSVKDLVWGNVKFTAGSKVVLENCWGEVKAGTLCAIMGASGAGKSSLLNVLAGRVASGGNINVSGFVSVGGRQINPVAFRQNIAYVMQDDILMSTATPREVLHFSAALRLAPDLSEEERSARVDKLLIELGIQGCADTVIGDSDKKGISGGERKRTSVGVELIAEPEVLFLDEPTSGLDSFAAYNCVETLRKVAAGGSAVLCSIHQPSSEVFFQFDVLVLMKGGNVMYQGSTAGIVAYFTARGFQCPPSHNPSDFTMFVSQTQSREALVQAGFFAPPEVDVVVQAAAAKGTTFDNGGQLVARTHPFARQLSVLLKRELQDTVRNKPALIGRFGITIFLSVLFGIVFFDAGNRDDAKQSNFVTHQGAITFLAINGMFGYAQPVLLSFPLARGLFMREYSVGTYGSAAYFFSKTASELILSLAQVNLQVGLLYLLVKFNGAYLALMVQVLLIGVASASVAVAVSCGVKDVRAASELAPAVFVPQILYAGFFVRMEQIPVWLRWPQYVCALKYGVNLMLLQEFGEEYCRSGAEENCSKMLNQNSVDEGLIGLYYGLLLAIIAGHRLLGAVILSRKALKAT